MSDGSRAIITGISGQDGWYLAERLLELGHEVIGTTHRAGNDELAIGKQRVRLVELDARNEEALAALLRREQPALVFNLAARASSAQLFDDPLATAEVNGLFVARWLEGIRRESPQTRFCQASSSEVFAGVTTYPQNESTPKLPLSAYGAAKAYADHLVAAYRATHGLFACSAVLFPHESPRRSPHFLMRKVARAAAHIARGREQKVMLGDLEATRDWGYAPDYMEAMRRMLTTSEPADFVIASGTGHTVRDVCEIAFAHVGLDWRAHVELDERFKRSPEAVPRIGDATRARSLLGWTPSYSFTQLVTCLVDADLQALED